MSNRSELSKLTHEVPSKAFGNFNSTLDVYEHAIKVAEIERCERLFGRLGSSRDSSVYLRNVTTIASSSAVRTVEMHDLRTHRRIVNKGPLAPLGDCLLIKAVLRG